MRKALSSVRVCAYIINIHVCAIPCIHVPAQVFIYLYKRLSLCANEIYFIIYIKCRNKCQNGLPWITTKPHK